MAVMVRAAGVPARVALGYVPGTASTNGTRAITTDDAHAWVEVYFSDLGWVPFDPTNNLLGGNQLIRVGVARDPSQAAPISGTWFGKGDAYLGMEATVQVRRQPG